MAKAKSKSKPAPKAKTTPAVKATKVAAPKKTVQPAPETLMVAPPTPVPAAVKKATRASAKMDEQAQKLGAKWQGLFNKSKTIQTTAYNMKNKYERQTAIEHKALGWGYILENKNDRLEVLFKDGIRVLISNYK